MSGRVPGDPAAGSASGSASGSGSGPADRGKLVPAGVLPVAHVAVDVPLAHLDRPFDYLVPAAADTACQPGVRVRVRFAGRLVNGYVLARSERSAHGGGLAYCQPVSAEPVLTPEIARLARSVADRYAGTLADVLRLAVPPRHARVEQEPDPAEPVASDGPGGRAGDAEPARGSGGGHGDHVGGRAGDAAPARGSGGGLGDHVGGPAGDAAPARGTGGGLGDYVGGPELIAALAAGRRPRVAWSALPGPRWPAEVGALARAAVSGGAGVLVVVPDGRDVDRVAAAVPGALTLEAGAGPAERYRRFLAIRRGRARVVVGSRAAIFAPVVGLGLIVLWDDGDDSLAEPRAPYPHARDVAALRAHQQGCGLVLGGHAMTAEVAQLLASGWLRPLAPARAVLREQAPRVEVTGSDTEVGRDEAARAARLPSLAWRTAKQALEVGPVLVQVPRRGYLPGLACQRCRTPARCTFCAGPLALARSGALPACRWCARPAVSWACPVCDDVRLRAAAVGARRTAEELGRALPGVPVRTSGRTSISPSQSVGGQSVGGQSVGGQSVGGPRAGAARPGPARARGVAAAGVLAVIPATPALIVATPGAEPVVDGPGYAAVLLLDATSLVARPDLRAGEEALRRWFAAAALAAPRAPVIIVAEAGLAPVQALVRWDPAGYAARELAERAELRFPPAVRMAALDGPPTALAALLATAELPPGAEVLGPVPVPVGPGDPTRETTRGERMLIRVSREHGAALAAALHTAQAIRSARKDGEAIRVQLDPGPLT